MLVAGPLTALLLYVVVLGRRLRVQVDEAGISVRNGIWAERRFTWDEVEDFRVGPGRKGKMVVLLVPRSGDLLALAVTQGRSRAALDGLVTQLRAWLLRRR